MLTEAEIEALRKYADAMGMSDAAIPQAATRDAITPYAYVYEWDYSPGVVHRSFSSAPYNGRRPDRTIQVFKAPKGDGND